jgi:rubrerythrin
MQDATEERQGRALIGQLVEEEKGHLKRLAMELGKYAGAR